MRIFTLPLLAVSLTCCNSTEQQMADSTTAAPVAIKEVTPRATTDSTPNDTDDPAIWYNAAQPERSLVLGTDKGDSTGGIFVFDLQGRMIDSLCTRNMKRPNNIDIAYGLDLGTSKKDIAVFTERGTDMIRVLALPECKLIDGGGIAVFEGDSLRDPMGVALYTCPAGNIYAIVGRKTGPADGYLHQYLLQFKDGKVQATKVRAFGQYSGKKEIEAIAVDNELGYIYYADETTGIRKYYADPNMGNQELALFGQDDFARDHEGISIFKHADGTGYIIVSDQQANRFNLYPREGANGQKHSHQLLRSVASKTDESDGNDIINLPLGTLYPKGLFVAMSTDKTFQYYCAGDIVQ
jgi:3-phytase